MPAIGAVRQVALSAGRDLDTTLAFWRDVLGMSVHARYDPPGIAFIMAGGVRLFFADGVPPGTVYLDIAGLEAFHAEAKAAGVPFTAPPSLVHRDTEGHFGPAGESEWMAFLKDPAGNTIGLVERLAPEEH
ncbi:glyoxalase [Mesorhizobium sp. M1C.F.Ca.ET.193.01.1.1]|uniref:VOC family protein n=2 Tax=Mesorhizobium TaxID=68287 RepID=UPI000FD2D847|nr:MULTISPECIES: VOC family protein [unclassified Mesorhizobium]TGT01388.1 glyoxalase [bacterium M00.F.Ca.ET.177.01.1.1]TGQ54148.1 glyoxalase [Mesorhizobium sp. M1C.F.Ca.ET.210.01.1.1]TGQ72162.1 glyoxalase [Mesorhizobium sp. M1C.F.Ca.ET.212.01.1.1]TGR09977.1 glyoxalase [Mesorhizobium sp. M1C.F.Ca.ET.204.01.1.1]TGR30097.1 glyoxalase [Mesorhizobium sp. M1C.F.Ca.ET.196.01.1.1]